jgi:signal transduction histidine kinase
MDVDRMERCVINLINNSQDVLREGGQIRVGFLRENGPVLIRVEDNGPGIPPEIRASVFDPFVTMGKQKGTGLGLAITKRVVDQHGGSIGFVTEPDKGTTFEIRIPRN